jgi:hypothetical protein
VKSCAACKRTGRQGSFLMLHSESVETKTSWAVASVALAILGVSFGAAWITVVALKDIASEVGGLRSVPAFDSALAWLGSGIGGILMSQIAERVGTRSTVIVGSLRPWPLDLDLRTSTAVMDRPRTVYRSDRIGRHQCAPIYLR